MDKKLELHGGNIYKIGREGARKLGEILDYSSNINPLGLPKGLKESIYEKMDEIVLRYPDPEYVELREKIAESNELRPENILVGNGATEIIFLYMKAIGCKKVLIVSPTFAEYERALRANCDKEKLEIKYFELKEEQDFMPDMEKLKEELGEEYDLLVMCNPNNPTGQFLGLGEMEEILRKCNEMQTKMFVDEAFVEFVEGWEEKTLVNTKQDRKNLFVLRAFTKIFAIPGLRLGYGICFDSELREKMMAKKEPWSVNGIAEFTGKIILGEKEYIEKTAEWIREEKKYFYEKIKEIGGLKPYKTNVNFILIKIDDSRIKCGMDVKKLRSKMMESNILIRDASNFVYLDNKYFRLAIKDRVSNDKVIRVLKKIMGE